MATDYVLKGLPLVNVVPFTAYVHPKSLCSEAELLQFHIKIGIGRPAMGCETNLVLKRQPREQRLNVIPQGHPFLVENVGRMRKHWLNRYGDALNVINHPHCSESIEVRHLL